MKRIIERPFKDYFKPELQVMDSISPVLSTHLRWSRSINPLTVMVALIAFSFLGGLFSLWSLSLGMALIMFLGFTWLQTKATAANLYVKRVVPRKSFFEFEDIEVKYTILNASGSKTPPLRVKDYFGPSKDQVVQIEVPMLLDKESRRSFLYKKCADSGMGIKQVGPISLCFTDAFGLFEFEVMEDEVFEVEVLPKVENLPDLSLVGSTGSQHYGLYNVSSKGNSVNFVGIREYEQGDSLKNIAWKLTAKRGDLLVKEFEKMVNAEVSIFLNMDPTLQFGNMETSTWEIIKDVALSITSQQIQQYNTVHFFTQGMYLNSLQGHQGMHDLARRLIVLDPIADSLKEEGASAEKKGSVDQLIRTYLSLQKAGGNILIITPYQTSDAKSFCETMKALKSMGMNVYCVIVDTSKLYSKLLKRIESKVRYLAPALSGLDEIVFSLKVEGIEVIVLDPDTSLQESFTLSGKSL